MKESWEGLRLQQSGACGTVPCRAPHPNHHQVRSPLENSDNWEVGQRVLIATVPLGHS